MWCEGQGCKVGYRCENIVKGNYNNEFSDTFLIRMLSWLIPGRNKTKK